MNRRTVQRKGGNSIFMDTNIRREASGSLAQPKDRRVLFANDSKTRLEDNLTRENLDKARCETCNSSIYLIATFTKHIIHN